MRTILVDATNISNKPTGAGNYAMSILREMNRTGVTVLVSSSLDKKHEFFSLGYQTVRLPVGTVGPKRDILLFWFFLTNKKKFSSYISFMPYAPLGVLFDYCTITIHDLTFWKYRPYVSSLKRWYLSFIIRQSIKKSHSIITVSESSKEDIKKFMHVPVPIYVVPNGIDEALFSSMKEKRLFKHPYLLHVGEHRPHKNIKQILYAFSFLKKRGAPHHLVLIGKPYKQSKKEIEKMISSLHLTEFVHLRDGVASKDLYAWYKHADVFVFPSLYEGFGIPLLESMTSGTPIVTSNTSALKEVAGSAAILVDPNSAKEIADAIDTIISHPSIGKELISAGKKRVKDFTWKKSSEDFEAIMRKFEE